MKVEHQGNIQHKRSSSLKVKTQFLDDQTNLPSQATSQFKPTQSCYSKAKSDIDFFSNQNFPPTIDTNPNDDRHNWLSFVSDIEDDEVPALDKKCLSSVTLSKKKLKKSSFFYHSQQVREKRICQKASQINESEEKDCAVCGLSVRQGKQLLCNHLVHNSCYKPNIKFKCGNCQNMLARKKNQR